MKPKNFSLHLFVFVLFCFFATAQSVSGSITGSSCVSIGTSATDTAAVQITGTWSGTIQPQAFIGGQPAFNVQVKPAGSDTAQNTITGNGTFRAQVAGWSGFQLCGATVTGTAKIHLNVRPIQKH